MEREVGDRRMTWSSPHDICLILLNFVFQWDYGDQVGHGVMGTPPPAAKPAKQILESASWGRDISTFILQNLADLFGMIGSFWNGLVLGS